MARPGHYRKEERANLNRLGFSVLIVERAGKPLISLDRSRLFISCYNPTRGRTPRRSPEGGACRDTTLGLRTFLCWNELEARLDPALFCRVSRAAIVNLDAVAEVRPMIGGIANVVLNTGVVLEVSRRRVKELLDRLQGAHQV